MEDSAKKILDAEKFGDLFTKGDSSTLKAEYRTLMKQYHPDVCKIQDADKIAAKINYLYVQAQRGLELGYWERSNTLEVHDTKGKKYTAKYLKNVAFELGEMYIADQSLTFIVEGTHKVFFDNAVSMIQSFKYANANMEDEMSRYIPKIRYSFQTRDGKYCLILAKAPDVFLLGDILTHYGGNIPDRHSAWIISRLQNLCCYFDYIGIAHNGLCIENCFIGPVQHSLALLGGWWYARPKGARLIGVPKSVYNIMPVKAKSDKISSVITDLEATKHIGLRIIGKGTTPPKAMSDFLNSGSQPNASKEFARWHDTLDAAYGERKFVTMDVKKTDIYKK